MNKRLLNTLVGGILVSVLFAGSSWAGQVVTEAHRSWAKAVVSREKTLQAISPSDTLAVLNFINNTNRPELDLLQKGLTLMLITDLSRINGLQVLERVKFQALFEELNLGVSGLVNEETAPRIGRLLRATYLVGGKIFDDDKDKIRIDPGILKTVSEEITDVPDTIGVLSEIFRMEKNILFDIAAHIKKEPLTVEETAMLRKPMTTSLRAFFLLIRGLEHSDRGNYRMATAFYKKALKADSDLSPAVDCLKELQELGLIFNKVDSKAFLKSLRDRTSLTDRLSPDHVLRRTRKPEDVKKRQSLRPPPPDDVDDDGDGYTENQGDCNDSNDTIHPGAREICGDGIDQDCNGSDTICPNDIDDDGDGYTENQGDCNDSNDTIYPGAIDICGDGIDQDCSGSDTICPNDIDDDGDGYTENQGDCDDSDASIYPGATEICEDGIDQDCSGTDAICPDNIDNDGDGYTENQGDCDDSDATSNPGVTSEICGDGADNNCDGYIDEGCYPFMSTP